MLFHCLLSAMVKRLEPRVAIFRICQADVKSKSIFYEADRLADFDLAKWNDVHIVVFVVEFCAFSGSRWRFRRGLLLSQFVHTCQSFRLRCDPWCNSSHAFRPIF